MKQKVIKWASRVTAAVLCIAGGLLIMVLNPALMYAHQTSYPTYNLFHHQALDPAFILQVEQAVTLLQASEWYDPAFQLDICLNDGSPYPRLIEALLGRAFAHGFYNKVVIHGTVYARDYYVEVNEFKWDLTQLLAHEMTHCFQFHALGFWHANPVAGIPNWKWEGYAEYISRQSPHQKDLIHNLNRAALADSSRWELTFEDRTIAPREYYDSWTMLQYCIDIQHMSYQQVLSDTRSESAIRQQMLTWYKENQREPLP
ncbi:MAG: hypothetical protein SFV52_15085 [Saprospiraceae bacterium]|nr:hypothetical protein [Saprospiraceae bacterium]